MCSISYNSLYCTFFNLSPIVSKVSLLGRSMKYVQLKCQPMFSSYNWSLEGSTDGKVKTSDCRYIMTVCIPYFRVRWGVYLGLWKSLWRHPGRPTGTSTPESPLQNPKHCTASRRADPQHCFGRFVTETPSEPHDSCPPFQEVSSYYIDEYNLVLKGYLKMIG